MSALVKADTFNIFKELNLLFTGKIDKIFFLTVYRRQYDDYKNVVSVKKVSTRSVDYVKYQNSGSNPKQSKVRADEQTNINIKEYLDELLTTLESLRYTGNYKALENLSKMHDELDDVLATKSLSKDNESDLMLRLDIEWLSEKTVSVTLQETKRNCGLTTIEKTLLEEKHIYAFRKIDS